MVSSGFTYHWYLIKCKKTCGLGLFLFKGGGAKAHIVLPFSTNVIQPIDNIPSMCNYFVFYGGSWYITPARYTLPSFLTKSTLMIKSMLTSASVLHTPNVQYIQCPSPSSTHMLSACCYMIEMYFSEGVYSFIDHDQYRI